MEDAYYDELCEALHDLADGIGNSLPWLTREEIVRRLRGLAGSDTRRRHVKDKFALTDQGLVDMLSLVCVTVPPERPAQWTQEQREQALNWAVAVHLDASDNDVTVPPRPEFLPE